MNWLEFVGNARAAGALRQMLQSGRIPQALLFSGPAGVGKFTLATLFARAANCLEKPGEGCERCANCRALTALDDLETLRAAALEARGSAKPDEVPLILQPHPCVAVVLPDPDYIRVAQMRYVVRQAYTLPAGGRRQVFLFDQAERLRFDFADVLLKVLEEPPESTTLILVTAAPYELRPTIRSRCIPIHFAPLARREIEAYLARHRPQWKKAERELAAAASAGSLGTALGLDLERFRQVRREALELVRAAAGEEHDPERLFQATATLAGRATRGDNGEEEGRRSFEFSLDILYALLTDILYLKADTPDLGLRNPDLRGELQGVSRRVSLDWLRRAAGHLDRVHGWQRRNVSRQLALDALALG